MRVVLELAKTSTIIRHWVPEGSRIRNFERRAISAEYGGQDLNERLNAAPFLKRVSNAAYNSSNGCGCFNRRLEFVFALIGEATVVNAELAAIDAYKTGVAHVGHKR